MMNDAFSRVRGTVSARLLLLAAAMLAASAPAAQAADGGCGSPGALGVAREVNIEAGSGGMYGSMTRLPHQPSLTHRKEVVLTFDDGPMPWVTQNILDTLDRYCVKATFFSVGRMALSYPSLSREVLARGHTLGTHTFSHPYPLAKLAPARAHDDIERGFAAVSAAAGQPAAPLFRFTGLADSAPLLEYLKGRGIAAVTVDVVSNDSYIHDPKTLVSRTLAEIDKTGGGIILFHDIKTATARALPDILSALKTRGYSVVHLKTARPVAPDAAMLAEYEPKVAKTLAIAMASPRRDLAPPALQPARKTADLSQKPNDAPGPSRIRMISPEKRQAVRAVDEAHTVTSMMAGWTTTVEAPWRTTYRRDMDQR